MWEEKPVLQDAAAKLTKSNKMPQVSLFSPTMPQEALAAAGDRVRGCGVRTRKQKGQSPQVNTSNTAAP